MNTKVFFAAAALCAATISSAFAQTPAVKDDGDKVKNTVDGMTTKTKVADDGKMKVKGKDNDGNSMKATTKPYKGKMAREMNGDMKGHGRKHKGMKRDSTMTGAQ
jgi:hypothetical protein